MRITKVLILAYDQKVLYSYSNKFMQWCEQLILFSLNIDELFNSYKFFEQISTHVKKRCYLKLWVISFDKLFSVVEIFIKNKNNIQERYYKSKNFNPFNIINKWIANEICHVLWWGNLNFDFKWYTSLKKIKTHIYSCVLFWIFFCLK